MGDSPQCACVDFPPRFLTYRKSIPPTAVAVGGMLLFLACRCRLLCGILNFNVTPLLPQLQRFIAGVVESLLCVSSLIDFGTLHRGFSP